MEEHRFFRQDMNDYVPVSRMATVDVYEMLHDGFVLHNPGPRETPERVRARLRLELEIRALGETSDKE